MFTEKKNSNEILQSLNPRLFKVERKFMFSLSTYTKKFSHVHMNLEILHDISKMGGIFAAFFVRRYLNI